MLPHCDREVMGYHGRSGEIEPPNGVISSNQQAIKGTRLVGAAELQHRVVAAGKFEEVVALEDHVVELQEGKGALAAEALRSNRKQSEAIRSN